MGGTNNGGRGPSGGMSSRASRASEKLEGALSRRSFLQSAAAAAAAAAAASAPGAKAQNAVESLDAEKMATPAKRRLKACYQVRVGAAKIERRRPDPNNAPNGDELAHPGFVAVYSKALPHDELGVVRTDAYAALLGAVASGDPADFEAIPTGGTNRLEDPQAGLTFDLQGTDSHHTAAPAPPAFSSAEAAAEMAELYWMALARDVPFDHYDSDATVAAAAAELTRMEGYRGRRVDGAVTPSTIFRGDASGELAGPYVSQFLLRDVPYGPQTISHKTRTAEAGAANDFMTGYDEWLAIQNGAPPARAHVDAAPRYMRTMRDIAMYVWRDSLLQSGLNAAMILLGDIRPPTKELPSSSWSRQKAFVDFGGPHLLTMVTEVALRALKAAWYHKWFVHRRLRPEELGGRVQNTLAGRAAYPIHDDLLSAAVLERIESTYGSHLLPQAYPEGSPTHPSYVAGHAAFAGAAVTILKAYFDESYVIANPVVASEDGSTLVPYTGAAEMTVGSELDKLAANIAIARNGAGVHYRSDGVEGIKLGEAVAISILEEQKGNFRESVTWSLTRYDGTRVTV